MKTAATIDAPADAGPASVTPEMFAHEWAPNGDCTNPETVAIALGKNRKATVFLGCAPDRSWHWGYFAELVSGDETAQCSVAHVGHRTREEALASACAEIGRVADANKDKAARKATDAFLAKTFPDRSPANKEASTVPVPEPAEIVVAAIEDNPRNERERPQEYIDELAADIRTNGLLQRIAVKLLPSAGDSLPGVPPAPRYRLLYGGCRLRAIRQLEFTTVRAEVYPLDLSPRIESRIIKAENLKRRGLNPIEEAQGFADHMAEFGLTQEELAKEVGKSRPVIANALRLLELPETVRELLAAGVLTSAHGTALARFKAWPEACSKIAELAVKSKAPAGMLEKNLPFGDELVKAGLAVDLREDACIYGPGELPKELKGNAAVFAWEDRRNYDECVFTLDRELGATLVAKEKERRAKEEARYASRGGERDEAGELTPAAKKARQKKIDDNLENRLAVSAIGDAAFKRLKTVTKIDVAAVASVTAEALKHCYGYGGDLEDLAKRLGIKVGKNFDGDPHDLAGLDPVDAIRLAAAAIAERETNDAMRYAGKVREEVLDLAQKKESDAEPLIADWKKAIKEKLLEGAKPEQIVEDLECPEFLVVNLARAIKREQREAADKASKAGLTDSMRESIRNQVRGGGVGSDSAYVAKMFAVPIQWVNQVKKDLELDEAARAGVAPAAKKPAKSEKAAPANAKKKGHRAVITDETRAQVKRAVEAGKTGAEIAKEVGISLPSVQNIKKALGLVSAKGGRK